LLGAFRGTPKDTSARAQKMRSAGKRLPCILPRGQEFLDKKIQFVHVDNMARLIAHILRREPETQRLTVLNVAGRGEPLTYGRCVEMAQAKLIRVPGKWPIQLACRFCGTGKSPRFLRKRFPT
jgi:nucleoside-diphosphate-sugar epimerase